MKTSDFYYYLPQNMIAQTPVEPRHASRLLVVRRDSVELEHRTFLDVADYLKAGDVLVINRTRVIPARLPARKASGGKAEILLIKKFDETHWEALVGGKRMIEGKKLFVYHDLEAEVTSVLNGARRIIQFSQPVEPFIEQIGQMPLPPYIHTRLEDGERYQTVYAIEPGSAAAPTAGLHFTYELIQNLKDKGVQFADITLHVGLDTFAPVTEEDARQHKIHTEWCEVDSDAAETINRCKNNGGRVIAVGTTSVRTVESATSFAEYGEWVGAFCGQTNLFILPGFQFKVVDAIITNFHLPCSTLIMLVSAFAGRERILDVYQQAISMNYRFYSFGDAMIIL